MRERAKLSRRGFVGAAAGTAAATTLGPWAPGAGARGRRGHHGERLLPRDLIGVQLFTVRDRVAADGFESVFAKLSSQGYREIEFAGYNAQGRRWTTQSVRHYDGIVVPGKDPMGRPLYWVTVRPIEEVEEHTDRWALRHGLTSITPLRLDLTDHAALAAAQRLPRARSAS